MNREEIKNNTKLLEQLESFESLHSLITTGDKYSWWKVLVPNSYDDFYIRTEDSRKSFIEWLESEIKVLKIQIGE